LPSKYSKKCIPPFIARQRPGKQVPKAKNAVNNRRVVGRMSMYPPFVARQQLGKDISAEMKNFWRSQLKHEIEKATKRVADLKEINV
jgi:hypothetical protein